MDLEPIRIKDLVEKLYPLHRTLVSDGTDEALEMVRDHMPTGAEFAIEVYAPQKRVWTWEVPERYVVHEAYLESEDGERVIDFSDNPLHLVSYSPPIDTVFSWEELQGHLHYSERRPSAIPWVYKYYDRDWGFCLSKNLFDQLSRDKKYRAVIRSEYVADPEQGLRVGVGLVAPDGGRVPQSGEFLICTHICHPGQANDDAAGVGVAVEVARRLTERPLLAGSMGVRFLFCPETIGSICYLSHHEDMIASFKGGVFIEMPGNDNILAFQRTRQDNHLLDRISSYVIEQQGIPYREDAYLNIARNDDKVINGPGVNIPCISLSRWPYDEYHTSDDNPDIVHEELLREMADVVEEIVRIYASNYMPKRKFRGPIFLSRYGLWVDPAQDMKLGMAQDKIMVSLEGHHSVFEIADEIGINYWSVRELLEEYHDHQLIDKLPIASCGEVL